MAFNKIKSEYNAIHQIVFGVEGREDATETLDLGSWKDSERNLHEFFYKDSSGDDGKSVKNTLISIYEIFCSDEQKIMRFWHDKIEMFEQENRIDFFTLLSFLYLLESEKTFLTPNMKDEAKVKCTIEACTVLASVTPLADNYSRSEFKLDARTSIVTSK